MAIYEVFQRKGPTEPMVHVGSVNAADTDLALVLAKECFFRREHPADLWVVRREDLHALRATDVLEPGTDKSYRSIEAYKGIARKRAQIEAALHEQQEQVEAAPQQEQIEQVEAAPHEQVEQIEAAARANGIGEAAEP